MTKYSVLTNFTHTYKTVKNTPRGDDTAQRVGVPSHYFTALCPDGVYDADTSLGLHILLLHLVS